MSHTRVLVVDDHDDHRETLAALLSDRGYACRSTAKLATAEQLVRSWRPQLVLYERKLVQQDAGPFPARVRSIAEHEGLSLSVVLVTTDDFAPVPDTVDKIVVKPITWRDFARDLERVLARTVAN